jgi:hypothetical protein
MASRAFHAQSGALAPNHVLVRHQRTQLAHPGQRLNGDEHVVFGAVFGADHALADGFHTR